MIEGELRWYQREDGSRVLQKEERLGSTHGRWVDVRTEYEGKVEVGVECNPCPVEKKVHPVNYPWINPAFHEGMVEFILNSIDGGHCRSYENWERMYNDKLKKDG